MNIMKTRWIWIGFSLSLMALSLVFLFIFKIPMGIDFSGGTVLEFSVKGTDITKDKITEKLKESEVHTINLRSEGSNTAGQSITEAGERFSLKSEELSNDKIATITTKVGELGEVKVINSDTIGPAVSRDTTKKAIIAVIVASLAIICYIAWSFRFVPATTNSWRFGITAVVALLHDLLITSGVMALYGHFYGFELDTLFITALLTIMGFSVHDTIVVFDRLRENLRQSPSADFTITANNAITQTIARSLNTSLTVILTLLALYLLGGESIHTFALTLLVGITIGTYSSIFVATILLVLWQQWSSRRNVKHAN